MTLDADVIARAKKLRPWAVTEVLKSQVAGVYRLAYALAGRWDVGRGIARFVLNRSVKMMPNWDAEQDPSNWYHRFTVMTSRRSAKHQPSNAKEDVLVKQALSPDAAYVAFVSALRKLDYQQREAFLLRHGEKLNERYSAVAMDCSTTAAATHLAAAEAQMKLVGGVEYEALLRKLVDAYQHLTPEEDQLLPSVNQVVFRRVMVRRWVRWVWYLVLFVVIGLLCSGAWKLWKMIET